jgi:steroid delta-isomerase-like uncharacterized protein
MTDSYRSLTAAFLAAQMTVALAEDVIVHDQAQDRAFTGRAAVQAFLRATFVDGFSDVVLTPQTVVADEQAAALELTFRGRHSGRFMGLPATGRVAIVPMTIVCRIAQGQIHQATLYYDAGALLRQLGLAL